MKIKVGKIAEVNTGLVLNRKQAHHFSKYNYKLLTLKSIESNGVVNLNMIEDFESIERIDSNYLTKEGDVLIKNTFPFETILINKTTKDLLVPSNFFIIRLKNTDILPEYLMYYLGNTSAQQYFIKDSYGTVLNYLKVDVLKNLEIVVSSNNTQKRYRELYYLHNKLLANLEKELEITKKIIQYTKDNTKEGKNKWKK